MIAIRHYLGDSAPAVIEPDPKTAAECMEGDNGIL
jgi:hypothetical protein